MASLVEMNRKLKTDAALELVKYNLTARESEEMRQRFIEVDSCIRKQVYGLGWANLGRIAFIIDQAKLRLAISPACLLDPIVFDPDELESEA